MQVNGLTSRDLYNSLRMGQICLQPPYTVQDYVTLKRGPERFRYPGFSLFFFSFSLFIIQNFMLFSADSADLRSSGRLIPASI